MNSVELASALGNSLRDTRLIVVAKREPYIHVRKMQPAKGVWNWLRGRRETSGVEWTRPASGLVTALDPVMRACGGTWIAHGSGSADRETADPRGRSFLDTVDRALESRVDYEHIAALDRHLEWRWAGALLPTASRMEAVP